MCMHPAMAGALLHAGSSMYSCIRSRWRRGLRISGSGGRIPASAGPKVRRGVRAEAAQVGTAYKKIRTSAHWASSGCWPALRPQEALLSAQPDAAVPVRTRLRWNGCTAASAFPGAVLRRLRRCAGHAAAVEVVHPVVTDLLAVYFVVDKLGIVFGAVHQAHPAAHDLAEKFLSSSMLSLSRS